MWFLFFFHLFFSFIFLVLTFCRHSLSLFVFPLSISTWCDAHTDIHIEKAAKWRKLARSSYLSQVHNPINSFDSTKYFSAISWRRTSHIQKSVRIGPFRMKLRGAKEFLILNFAPSVSFSFHLDRGCLLARMDTACIIQDTATESIMHKIHVQTMSQFSKFSAQRNFNTGGGTRAHTICH